MTRERARTIDTKFTPSNSPQYVRGSSTRPLATGDAAAAAAVGVGGGPPKMRALPAK